MSIGKRDVHIDTEVSESVFTFCFFANVICIFLASAIGIICTISYSPISISMFAIVVVCTAFILAKFNVSKIKEGIRNANITSDIDNYGMTNDKEDEDLTK